MPRRQFVADLAAVVANVSIAGISDVQSGGDDGEFTFMCVADGQKLKISALIPGKFSHGRIQAFAYDQITRAATELTFIYRTFALSSQPQLYDLRS